MTPAILYARFSPRPNPGECDSVEKQIERCRAYCTAHDYQIIGTHHDKDKSGGRADNRPGLQAAIKAACQAKAILCVYSLSRLARSTKDAIELADRLNKCGADLASLQENVDTRSPMGKFVFTLFSALAQMEREQISERTSRAMRHHQANGRRMGRKDRVPYGKMVDPTDDTRLVDCPEEQKILEEIKLAANAGYGPTAIAKRLNEYGRPCRGKKWRAPEVCVLIKRMAG